jgi:hypothetical protein
MSAEVQQVFKELVSCLHRIALPLADKSDMSWTAPVASVATAKLRDDYIVAHSSALMCIESLARAYPLLVTGHTQAGPTSAKYETLSDNPIPPVSMPDSSADSVVMAVDGLRESLLQALGSTGTDVSDAIQMCTIACANGIKRRDTSESGILRSAFDRFKEPCENGTQHGLLSPNSLLLALKEVDAAVVPINSDESKELFEKMDVGDKKWLSFDDFLRAASSKDELESWLAERNISIIADALRVLVPRIHPSGDSQLIRLSQLHPDLLGAACDAASTTVHTFARNAHMELKDAIGTLTEMQQHAQRDAGVTGKFSVMCEMKAGSIDDFHKGLTERVGFPNLEFEEAMKAEHCSKAGFDKKFTTGNYKITTTPKQEWLYIVGDENGLQQSCPDMAHGRRIESINTLLEHPVAIKCNISRPEMIALVLYTGPMFQVLNTILRQYPEDQYTTFKNGGNLFTTTIFVLVSAVQKISRRIRILPGTLLYRGLGGRLDLPKSLLQIDENGCRGFAEWGFMSTTTDKQVALDYSGALQKRLKAAVLVIYPSSVDRGADISVFSQ